MLEKFLDAKPLYYDEIDYSRMPKVYEKIKTKLKNLKTIHLIGTNGKGTTGRFLASALYAKGYRVGHYTSPHIMKFNERVWINGADVSTTSLNLAHKNLLMLLTEEESNSLSYFEYTTLLAIFIFQNLDYVVLEAGLGGEYDATAVFPKVLTLVTPIDKDHEAFLGTTIKEIATTKLNAIENRAILAEQSHSEVYAIATKLAKEKELTIYKVEELLKEQDYKKVEAISKTLSLAPYLIQNLKLSISALNLLEIEYDAKDFYNSKLFGRLTSINDNIIVDVGHNILAAQAIFNSLYPQKYILVYNSYKDKNYKEILTVLQAIIKHIEIIDIDENRIEDRELLVKEIDNLNLQHRKFLKIDKDEKYLVFGSFSVVEQFLKVYNA
ncbi:MAG: bifunctional folylpolyglutamate synthase/dihydrofolate synthase [Campylobacterota bacterium]|nr:bifunctional folylpolyglutamate synthase/dihydrofolate synthase [Campylobacterota bacterium]